MLLFKPFKFQQYNCQTVISIEALTDDYKITTFQFNQTLLGCSRSVNILYQKEVACVSSV